SADTDAPPGRVRRANVGRRREGDNPPSRVAQARASVAPSSRRSCTNRASSASGGLRLNSSKARQVSRTSSPARSAPARRSVVASSARTDRRSACATARWAPTAVTTRSRYQDASSSSEAGSPRVDLLTDRALREPSKRNELAARPDRLGQRAEVVGDEHDHRVRRRLLEVLEESVRSVLVHRLGGVDEVDAPFGFEGAHV